MSPGHVTLYVFVSILFAAQTIVLSARAEADMSNPARKVVLVVVTYHPDWAELYVRIDSLRSQVDDIVVVDNGSTSADGDLLEAPTWSNFHRLSLDDNWGIAKAQNRGIEWARAREATHVILLDQDSEPASDMVERLVRAAQELELRIEKLGVIAPRFVDVRQGQAASFFGLHGLHVVPLECAEGEEYIPITAAIASGSLLSLEALKAVGGMCDELFIDLVDIEWCMRARSLGYQSFGVCDAVLYHRLGESPRSVFGRKVPHHSPLRSYYFYRNAVWLCRQGYVPFAWKFGVARQLLLRGLFYSTAVAPRLIYLRMMTLGLWHGFRGRLGRFD